LLIFFLSEIEIELKAKDGAKPAQTGTNNKDNKIGESSEFKPLTSTDSNEGRNYKFYEDIVSFEDNGDQVSGPDQAYQMIGEEVKQEKLDEETSTRAQLQPLHVDTYLSTSGT
jgi:hypothetical protein